MAKIYCNHTAKIYCNHMAKIYCTVKPLSSGHLGAKSLVSATQRCPLLRGFVSKFLEPFFTKLKKIVKNSNFCLKMSLIFICIFVVGWRCDPRPSLRVTKSKSFGCKNSIRPFPGGFCLCGTFRKVSASASRGCPFLRVFFIKEKPVFAGTFELVSATWRCPLPRVSASRRFHCIPVYNARQSCCPGLPATRNV